MRNASFYKAARIILRMPIVIIILVSANNVFHAIHKDLVEGCLGHATRFLPNRFCLVYYINGILNQIKSNERRRTPQQS